MASIPDLFTRGGPNENVRRIRTGDRRSEVYETDDEVVLEIEMPGFETDDIDLVWRDGTLTVGAHTDAYGDDRVVYRTVDVPREIDETAIDARYRNGVLEVSLPVTDSTPSTAWSIPVGGSS